MRIAPGDDENADSERPADPCTAAMELKRRIARARTSDVIVLQYVKNGNGSPAIEACAIRCRRPSEERSRHRLLRERIGGEAAHRSGLQGLVL